jgi:hypothetical protein
MPPHAQTCQEKVDVLSVSYLFVRSPQTSNEVSIKVLKQPVRGNPSAAAYD